METLTFAIYCCHQALIRWLFITAPQHARHLVRWCGKQLHFLAQVIGDHAGRATQSLLQVFNSSEIHSADGSRRLVGGPPKPYEEPRHK